MRQHYVEITKIDFELGFPCKVWLGKYELHISRSFIKQSNIARFEKKVFFFAGPSKV